MFWLIYVTVNIHNVVLRLKCRHIEVCVTGQWYRQALFNSNSHINHNTPSNLSHPALFSW